MGSAKCNSDLKQGWLRAPTNGQVIVFIHGFTGSASSTWGSQACTWPEIVTSDSRFDGVGVFLAEYESKLDFGRYGFKEASRQVMTQLEVASSSGPKVTDFDTIMFVGHSAGGVISRDILVHNLWAFRGKRIGLSLVGSPSKGSSYADLGVILRDIVCALPYVGGFLGSIGGKQLSQLTTSSEYLLALNAKFQLLIDNDFLTIVGREFVEHKGKVSGTPPIVGVDSAAVFYKAESVIIAGSDHASICRPDSDDAQVHRELVRLWNDLLATRPQIDEGVRQAEAGLRNEADLKLFQELQKILGVAPERWQEWSPGIPYEDEWMKLMWRFQDRSAEADCFFHDQELQTAHARHLERKQELTLAQSQESESLRDGKSQISKYGKGTRSATHAHKDLYDEALERVEIAHDAWIEAYRDYIKTVKSRLIL